MKNLKSNSLLLVSLLLTTVLFACSGNDPESGNSNSNDNLSSDAEAAKSRMDVLLDSFIGEPNVVNTMVSVSNELESGSFSVSKGEASPGIPMSGEHQFHIASMSKPFTAVLLLQLVEEGYFSLDTTLTELFGDLTMAEIFPDYTFFRSDPGSRAVAEMTIDHLQEFGGEAQGGSITIRQLTQHTHGMPDLTFDEPTGGNSLANITIAKFAGLIELDPEVYPDQWSGTGLLEYYLASGLPSQSFFPTSQGYHYGDTGPVVAALIIERVTGMSLAQAYRTRIFDPLGMDDTYLHHYEEPRQSRSAGVAHRHFDLTEFFPEAGNVDVDAASWNTSIDWAGGGLVSTAGDLDRFFRGLFDGDLLSDPSVIGNSDYRVNGDEQAPFYGLGLALQISADGSEVVAYEHGGFWGSYMMYVPSTNTSVSFTANQVIFNRFDEYLSEVRALYLSDQ